MIRELSLSFSDICNEKKKNTEKVFKLLKFSVFKQICTEANNACSVNTKSKDYQQYMQSI